MNVVESESIRRAGEVRAEHVRRAEAHHAEVIVAERRSARIGVLRLAVFVGGIVAGAMAFRGGGTTWIALFAAAVSAFAGLIVVHARTLTKKVAASARFDVHTRHLARMDGRLDDLPEAPSSLLPDGHPYSADIDLVGAASLFRRIDVTRTTTGATTLASWLGAAADADAVRARQEAVRELTAKLDFRVSLEASLAAPSPAAKLVDHTLRAFVRHRNGDLDRMRWLGFGLPLLTAAFVGAGMLWPAARPVTAFLVFGQGIAALLASRSAFPVFALVDARRGQVEAYRDALTLVDETSFESALLASLRERIRLGHASPSVALRGLDRLAGFAALRHQFLLHFPANVLFLWDLHVASGLARWRARFGASLPDALDALAEIEALSSLATLAHQDPDAAFPEIAPPGAPFEAEQLAHPLLSVAERVANDVSLPGEGSLLLVTGSNMAGKSTLLRSVGLAVALAFAGGPVVARRLRTPPVRLRASMRIDDSLARGASYFHAELEKLRSVVESADEKPPVFFLLDELLRGTNAKARHEGARAVLRHLLGRGALGLAATHDLALASLEAEQPDAVRNVHFTDVVVDGEMRFDYLLRPGVVETSNALRLLRAAGVDVPDEG